MQQKTGSPILEPVLIYAEANIPASQQGEFKRLLNEQVVTLDGDQKMSYIDSIYNKGRQDALAENQEEIIEASGLSEDEILELAESEEPV